MQNPGQYPGSGRSIGRAIVILAPAIIASFVAWSLFHTIEPIHARRDALLLHLRNLAAEVNAYRERNGSLPQSLRVIPKEYCPYPDSGYQLIVQPDHRDFLVVADHVSKDTTGAEFHFAADSNLQIQKVPCAKDQSQTPSATDKPRG
jgi:hypothetical protein